MAFFGFSVFLFFRDAFLDGISKMPSSLFQGNQNLVSGGHKNNRHWLAPWSCQADGFGVLNQRRQNSAVYGRCDQHQGPLFDLQAAHNGGCRIAFVVNDLNRISGAKL
jgi:hypothetical protein